MLRTRNTGQLNLDRVFARSLVILGGLFWIFTALGAQKAAYTQYVYKLPELAQGALVALVPLAITVVMFAVGLYFERLAGTRLVPPRSR